MGHESFKITGDRGDSFRSSKTGSKGKPKKDFQKVLAKKEQEQRQFSQEKEKVEEGKGAQGKETFDDVVAKLEEWEKTPSKKDVSLFELAGKKEETSPIASTSSEEETIPISEFTEDVHNESLSALFKGYGSKNKLNAIQNEVLNEPKIGENTVDAQTTKSDKSKAPFNEPMQDLAPQTGRKSAMPQEKGRFADQFADEPTNLSAVNPMAGTPSPAAASSAQGVEKQQSMAPQMKEMIDQIINKLYTISKNGQTDTVIKLQHPPLFAGAGVVISSFDSAKGEFNITFENLTQAAKEMLDMQENREALKFALDQKGFAVHIITTTTLTETLAYAEEKSPPGEKEEKKEGKQQESSDTQEQQE